MNEHSLFLAALGIADPAERADYLRRACASEPALQQQVEALLAAHERSGEFLDVPALEQMGMGADEKAFLETSAESRAAAAESNLSFLQPSTRPDSLGCLGHYEVQQAIGRGGCGIVLKAFDERLQRAVAIKVMAPELAETSPARKRFLREARAAAAVRHEHVVSIYTVEEQPLPFLVMEYIAGQTLQHKIDQTGPLDLREVLHIGQQIASGLEAAHAMGLIHRDIKPANILLEKGRDCVKITDFGLARASDDASLTQSGMIAGTPLYMSPEQAQGGAIDQRSDLFSLGSVLYVMCCGRPPFRASSTLSVLKRIADDQPRPIQEIIPEVPAWLTAIITRLHAKRPEDRFATAREVAELLRRCLAELQLHGHVASLGEIFPDGEKPEPQVQKAAPGARPGSVTRHDRSSGVPWRRSARWVSAALVLVALFAGLGMTEATGVTNLRGTVVRLLSPDGTLVVEVDDPEVTVSIDGEELVITGAGAKEIRLRPGEYKVLATKDGQLMRQELVTVTTNGRQVVRVSREPASLPVPTAASKTSPASAEQQAFFAAVAALPAAEQVAAVRAKLAETNPGFKGPLRHRAEEGRVVELAVSTDEIDNLWPVRAFAHLKVLDCSGSLQKRGKLADLSPLAGLPLTALNCRGSLVADLSPLSGMPLVDLDLEGTNVATLEPLKGLKLTTLDLHGTQVVDLAPLAGMPLKYARLGYTRIANLAPLAGAPLETLIADNAPIADLSPLASMPLTNLTCSNTLVSDLTPLKGLPLKTFTCAATRVTDLTPLAGMPLTSLLCSNTRVADLSPLSGMPLVRLECKNTRVADLGPLKRMPLQRVSIDVRLYDAEDEALLKSLPLLPPARTVEGDGAAAGGLAAELAQRRQAAEKFVAETAQLTAEKQVAAVKTRLEALNGAGRAGLGQVIVDGAIVEATLSLANATGDITPLMAFTRLKKLTLNDAPYWLDLSPLKLLPLAELNCSADAAVKNSRTLQGFDTLKAINGTPAGEYWKSVRWLNARGPDGADGKDVILSGDILQVVQDRRWLRFMYSYPNFIPLSASAVRHIVEAVEPFQFDRIYGAWWGKVVRNDGKAAVNRSAERYIRAIEG